jgi:hypothetical protein
MNTIEDQVGPPLRSAEVELVLVSSSSKCN